MVYYATVCIIWWCLMSHVLRTHLITDLRRRYSLKRLPIKTQYFINKKISSALMNDVFVRDIGSYILVGLTMNMFGKSNLATHKTVDTMVFFVAVISFHLFYPILTHRRVQATLCIPNWPPSFHLSYECLRHRLITLDTLLTFVFSFTSSHITLKSGISSSFSRRHTFILVRFIFEHDSFSKV